MSNVVNWGLRQSAWAEIIKDDRGNETYGTLKKLIGVRVINFSPQGDLAKEYADGGVVYTGRSNDGYTGTMEFSSMPEDFWLYITDEMSDKKNVAFENQVSTEKKFVLLWEWEQDKKGTRHIMYSVVANRPDLNSTTSGDGGSMTFQRQTLNISASPRKKDRIVKARTTSETDEDVYNNWFTTLYVDPDSTTRVVKG